jgi:hypothetical protein
MHVQGWDEMTPNEKIEELRRDVLKTMETVNLCALKAHPCVGMKF